MRETPPGPGRAPLASRWPSRLRWQLTLSHMLAIAFTLVSMIAAALLIGSLWVTIQSSPAREPAVEARFVASAVDGLVVGGAPSAELSAVLRALASGDLSVLLGPGPFGPGAGRRQDRFGPSLQGFAYLAIVAQDGRLLGSSDPAGAAFAPPERTAWEPLVAAALAGERDPRRLVDLRAGDGPAVLGVAPIFDGRGRAVAAVVAARTTLPPPDRFGRFWHALAIFSAATVAILAAAFVFALASSSLVAYLLARRLVGRLERLGSAAESLAAGDLDRRVDVGPPDEVGQLARRFNHMANRLATTVAELESEKQHAEAALLAKRELVANVSHELRTPLASIRGHTESLLMPGAEGEGARRREYLAVIDRETEHLRQLIDDLFLLSTAEAGVLQMTPRPVDLAEVVEEVARSVRPVAHQERRVSVVTQVDRDLPLALADRERVVQVLANLVRNALRHTAEGGLVSLQAGRDDDRVRVTVEDTGVGIPPEQLPRVFERFYRGDDARDRASGGAGLGLAIVRELVEAMGGDVSAESVVGEGSRFSFTLPLVRDAKRPRAAPAGQALTQP